MLDTLTSQNRADFRQRYLGTYGYLIRDSKKILVRIEQVEEDYVEFIDEKGNPYHVNCDSGIPFEFIPVDRRLVNLPKYTIYACRRPARMWRRGVCSENTTIVNVETKRHLTVGFQTVGPVYQPENQDYIGAFNSYLNGERKSAAISDRFCVLDGKVFLYDIPIGFITDSKARIHPMFKQEVSDICTRNKLPIKVEVYHEE